MPFSHKQTTSSPSYTRRSASLHSRRRMLKGCALFFAVGAIAPFAHIANAEGGKPKVLTVFFSKTGNTRALAQQIHTVVGGDMVELKTAHIYPDDHEATVKMAIQERRSNARPQLPTQLLGDVNSYDVIFAGYPVWEYTMPMAFFTFFEQYSFAGKTIIPFSTHLGSGLGNAPEDITALCPQARLLQGLAVRGTKALNAQAEVQQWLQALETVLS